MPREQLFLTPLTSFDLASINEFVTQLNQRMIVIQEALAKAEGIDNQTPAFFNDVDMQNHTLKNLRSISFAAPITQGPLADPILITPGTAPASATVLRDDLATRTIPTILKALVAITVQMNAILSRLK